MHSQNTLEYIDKIKRTSLVDARIILICFLLISSLSLSYTGIERVICAFIFTAFLYRRQRRKLSLKLFSLFCFFCLFWAFIIFLIKSISFNSGIVFLSLLENACFALQFALKLYLLGILAFCIYISASLKEYALALAYFGNIFSKKYGYILGLLALLVFKAFYDIFALSFSLKKSLTYKFRNTKHLPFYKKISFFMYSLLVLLEKRNQELSRAIFSKKMHTKEAFMKEWPAFSGDFAKENFQYLLLLLFSLLLYFFNIY